MGLKNYKKQDKIILRVTWLYALYKQIPSLLLCIGFSVLARYLTQYNSILYFGSLLIMGRAIYSFAYYRLIKMELYNDRLNITRGVFSLRTSFLELYRVKDFEQYQSFVMRIFSIINVSLLTSDRTEPIVYLNGIVESNIVHIIRNLVEEQRRIKGVREFD